METSPRHTLVHTLSRPLYRSRHWLRLLGGLILLNGILIALTLVGLIVAWLPIWLGMLLWQCASAAEAAHLTGASEELLTALNRISVFFTILGVLTLITLLTSLLLTVLGLLDIHGFMIGGMGQMGWHF